MEPLAKPLALALFGVANLCLSVQANPALIGSGFSLTTGYVTNPHNLHSAAHNPAGIDFLVRPSDSLRMGFVGSNIGAQYEIGDITGMKNTIDQINAMTSKNYTNPIEMNADLNHLNNDLLPQLEKGGQISIGANLQPLLSPVVWRSEALGGTLSLGLDAELQFNSRFKAADAVIQGGNSITTNSGFDMRAVTLIHPSIGYATQPFGEFRNASDAGGRIDVGTRVHLYSATTLRDYKMVSSNNSTDVSNTPRMSSSALGLDLGVMNTHESFQWGLTAYNLNNPQLTFPDIPSSNSAGQAQAAAGKIPLNYTAQLKAQMVAEASVFNESRSWILQVSHALNPSINLVGEEKQYSTISAGFYPRFESSIANFLTPTFRLGLRQNQVGSQLTTASLGLSLFSGLNIDVWTTLQTVSYDGNQNIPRSAGASLGWASTF